MMQYEFEELAGYEVSTKDYNDIIEPMYMAVNLSKAEFVKIIDKKRFALKTERQLVNMMKKEAAHLEAILGKWTDYESADRLNGLASEYVNRFYRGFDWFFHKEYEYAGHRGCSYPSKLVICSSKTGTIYKEIKIA